MDTEDKMATGTQPNEVKVAGQITNNLQTEM